MPAGHRERHPVRWSIRPSYGAYPSNVAPSCHPMRRVRDNCVRGQHHDATPWRRFAGCCRLVLSGGALAQGWTAPKTVSTNTQTAEQHTVHDKTHQNAHAELRNATEVRQRGQRCRPRPRLNMLAKGPVTKWRGSVWNPTQVAAYACRGNAQVVAMASVNKCCTAFT